jgi:hypothetical protein
MNVPTIPIGPELAELIDADPKYAERYKQCLRDIEACESVEELKRCTSPANLGGSYAREWTSHHGMVQRAGRNNIPVSDDLRNFAAFLVHVGPKAHYEATGKLSLDKTNSRGYILGHIRWQHPEGQTRNRSCSKFHLYKGRYYNAKELAVLLSSLSGKPVKADAVKKRRLRGKTTADQFAIAGVPYESGQGSVSDWAFPPAYASKMATLFRVNHRKGETRIDFFIRWLRTRVIPGLETSLLDPAATADQRSQLRELAQQCGHALSNAELELKSLRRENISQEIANSVYQPFNMPGAAMFAPNANGSARPENYGSPALPAPAPAGSATICVPTVAAHQSTHDDAHGLVAVAGAAHEPATSGSPDATPAHTGKERASILDPMVHGPLLADLAHVCETANVLPEFVRCSAKPFLTAAELRWVRYFKKHRKSGCGLVLTGKQAIPPEIKFQAIAGVLIRNYVDARVISVHTLLSLVEDDELPVPTVLLIPNLYLASQSKALPAWRLHALHDLLIQRRCSAKVTVVYVEELTKMEIAFGPVFAQHVTYGNELISAEC